ncbi:MAG: VWA domain-containing protein [Cellvibrio sp.]|nr:VWA domain-containing protein [Cellvibrio sp.]
MFEFSFLWLFLLLPLPLLMARLKAKEQTQAALRVPFYQQAQALQQNVSSSVKSSLKKISLWLIWLATLCAAANPQWVGDPVKMPSSGRDLLLVVDLSESMLQEDMIYRQKRYNRLEAVKIVMGEFIARRTSDRLGLILFADNAYLQAPLTFDTNTVQQMLWESEVYMAGVRTAIGDAIALGIKRLKDYPDNKRVMILLTDGQNTAGEITPEQATDLAVTAKTKVYTIAFSPYEQEVDGEAMRYIADMTGGDYFRARSMQELDDIHHQLDQLEPSEADEETFRPVKKLFYWPLALAFLLSLWLVVLQLIKQASFQSVKMNGGKA